MIKEEEKFLIGEITRDEPSQTTCTYQKKKSQKQPCKFSCLFLHIHICTYMFYGKVYSFSGDKENQNPKWVKTVSKTAAKSAGQCFIQRIPP